MSSPTMSHSTAGPVSPLSVTPPTDRQTAHFATRWLSTTVAVITADGEVDAANAPEFVDYAVRCGAHLDRLVLDLSGVDFFGTAGFSALHTINVQYAGEGVTWAVVPSRAVDRLLQICDPDCALPTCASVDAALSTPQGEPHRLLQLITKAR